MKKVKFGIVGCGRIGTRHAKHIQDKGMLVSVCDTDTEKADTLANSYGVKAYYSLEDLLANEKSVDVVAICTPNGLHAAHTITALRAGKHVLCEKPMAISPIDCGEMIKEAERANRRLFIVKQNRFNPPVVAVKKALDEGKFGKIYSIQLSCFWNRNEDYYANSWKGTMALDGGTLYTPFSHFIDLIYWMFGDVASVYAFCENFHHKDSVEFEDTGAVIMKFHTGIIGTLNYSVNACKRNMEGSITIIGEKGTVKIGGEYLNTLEYQQFEDYEIGELPEGNAANNYGSYTGTMSNHDKVYENVVDVLANDAAISTNMFEGLKTVEIIDRIYKSVMKK